MKKRNILVLLTLTIIIQLILVTQVQAQEAKQLSGLDKLEKRLLKAQKRKLKDAVDRVLLLQEGLFPEGGLQERNRNFSEFFLSAGPGLLGALLEDFEPLGQDFSIFTYPL